MGIIKKTKHKSQMKFFALLIAGAAAIKLHQKPVHNFLQVHSKEWECPTAEQEEQIVAWVESSPTVEPSPKKRPLMLSLPSPRNTESKSPKKWPSKPKLVSTMLLSSTKMMV